MIPSPPEVGDEVIYSYMSRIRSEGCKGLSLKSRCSVGTEEDKRPSRKSECLPVIIGFKIADDRTEFRTSLSLEAS